MCNHEPQDTEWAVLLAMQTFLSNEWKWKWALSDFSQFWSSLQPEATAKKRDWTRILNGDWLCHLFPDLRKTTLVQKYGMRCVNKSTLTKEIFGFLDFWILDSGFWIRLLFFKCWTVFVVWDEKRVEFDPQSSTWSTPIWDRSALPTSRAASGFLLLM